MRTKQYLILLVLLISGSFVIAQIPNKVKVQDSIQRDRILQYQDGKSPHNNESTIGNCIRGKVAEKGKTSTSERDIEFKKRVMMGNLLTKTEINADEAGESIFTGYEKVRGIFYKLKTHIGMLQLNPEERRIAKDLSLIRYKGFNLAAGYQF